jgi:hypothetical protein
MMMIAVVDMARLSCNGTFRVQGVGQRDTVPAKRGSCISARAAHVACSERKANARLSGRYAGDESTNMGDTPSSDPTHRWVPAEVADDPSL